MARVSSVYSSRAMWHVTCLFKAISSPQSQKAQKQPACFPFPWHQQAICLFGSLFLRKFMQTLGNHLGLLKCLWHLLFTNTCQRCTQSLFFIISEDRGICSSLLYAPGLALQRLQKLSEPHLHIVLAWINLSVEIGTHLVWWSISFQTHFCI